MDDDRVIEAAVIDPTIASSTSRCSRPRSPTSSARPRQGTAPAADRRRPPTGEPVDHLLFSGRRGSARPLAQIVANAMGAGFQPTSGPARPAERPRRDPHEPRRRRRAVRRRGPPHATSRRGGALPGARGLRARRGAREGPTARSIRLDLPRSRSSPPRPGGASPCAPVSGSGSPTPRLLPGRRPRPHRRAFGGILEVRPRRTGRHRDRPTFARHTPHREGCSAGARLRRGSARRSDHGRGGRAGLEVFDVDEEGSTASTTRSADRAAFRRRSASRRSRPRSVRSPTRSRTSSSPTCCSWGSCSVRPAVAWRPSARTGISEHHLQALPLAAPARR